MPDLRGEIAIVTGGRNGRLGPIWVDALEAAGATVHSFDLPSHDVRDVGAIERAVKLIRPTIVVNNAGVDSRPSAADYEALAASITFLLSDDGVNVNGVILPSDGGWSAV